MSAADERKEITVSEDYFATFEGFKPGQNVLEDLVAKFHDRPIYVPGGLEASRETEKRAAQKAVIEYILRRIGQVHDRGEVNEA